MAGLEEKSLPVTRNCDPFSFLLPGFLLYDCLSHCEEQSIQLIKRVMVVLLKGGWRKLCMQLV